MIVYPLTLPCNLQTDDKSTQGASFIRSQFIYAPRQRKTKCAIPTFTASFNYSQSEYDAFRAFYEDDLKQGANEFECNWFIHGIVSTSKIVRFITPYSYQNLGNGILRVSAQFELLNKGA